MNAKADLNHHRDIILIIMNSCIMIQMLVKHNDQEYPFKLNNHIILNKKYDSWKELPVFKEDEKDMLPGKLFKNLQITYTTIQYTT